jgi:phenylpropionate dioxygenase-like ring-hydroxylating dioxygenase large terminal subunit
MNFLYYSLYYPLLWCIINNTCAFVPPSSIPQQKHYQPQTTQPITPIVSKTPITEIQENKTNQTYPINKRKPHNTVVINNPIIPQPPSLISEKRNHPLTEEDFQFQLQWYVISESKIIRPNTPYEAKIWGKTYVYWKDQKNNYYAIQNICNHRGAFLSKGTIDTETNCIQCPYHGVEFDGNGMLKKIPGQKIPASIPSFWNQAKYPILEKEGWIYLNIVPEDVYSTENISTEELAQTLYSEPEASIQSSSRVFHNIPSIPTYARIVSENLLDILHITYVHSFGNKDSPIPLNEPLPYTLRSYNKNGWIISNPVTEENQTLLSTTVIPTISTTPSSQMIPSKTKESKPQKRINIRLLGYLIRNQIYAILNPITTITMNILSNKEDKQNQTETGTKNQKTKPIIPTFNYTIPSKNQHYGIRYLFETNPNSLIRNVFQYHHIIIETEFLLPHLTVSRVRFGPFYKTVVSFTLPVTEKETHLFIKLYRNYWLKDSIPSFPFPFSILSYLTGTILESFADSLMLWMLKETFKEDAGVLERLTNDLEQQGRYNLKYDKFPYLYRNLYKKHIHSKESIYYPPFSPSFPVFSPSPLYFIMNKNTSFPNSFPNSFSSFSSPLSSQSQNIPQPPPQKNKKKE